MPSTTPSSSSFASSSLIHAALTFLLLPVSTAFQVDYKAPKQCTSLDLTFSGTANPPFKLLILPFASTAALQFNVPDNAWNTTSKTGTFHTTIPLASGTKFLMSMDDGMGRGTGGVSDILEMQKSDDASCLNDSQPASPQVTFEPPAPVQCKPLTTSWSSKFSAQVKQPISIRGFVPGKNAFSLDMVANATKNVWTVDVPADSQFMLTLHDGDGGILETSPLMASTNGSDTSCLLKTDAVGGPNAPKASTIPSAVPAAAATSDDSQATPSNGGTIAGGIVGALVLVGIIAVGSIMFFRKQRNQVSARDEIGDEPKTDFRPISMPPPPLPPKSPSYQQRFFGTSPSTPAMTSTPVTATHLLASSTTLDAEPESPEPSSAAMSYDSHHPIVTNPSTTPQERRRTLTVPTRQEAVRTELQQELPDATTTTIASTGTSTNIGKSAGSGNGGGAPHITRSATAFAGTNPETRLAPVAAITRSASTSAATPSNNNVVFTSRPPPRMQVPQTPLTPHDHFSGFSNRMSTASSSGGQGFGMNSRPSSSRISRNSDILQFANLADMVSIGNEEDVPAVPALPPNTNPAPIYPSTPTRNQYPDEKAVYRRQAEAQARANNAAYQGTLPLDVPRDRQGLGLSLSAPPPSYDSLQ